MSTSGIIPVDLLAGATDPGYFSNLVTTNVSNPSTIALLSYNDTFATNVLGPNATARQLYNLPWQAFHEMGTYNRDTKSLYVTSNYVSLENPINVTVIDLSSTDYKISSTRYSGLAEANGGTNWFPPGSDKPHLLFCDEGDFTAYSGLVSVDPTTNVSTPVVNSFHGRNFSSVNDVRQHPITGDLWFTDADYGYFQFFRPPASIPKQVYRFNPSTGEIAVVADGFVEPNGLEFSPDLKTLYVTDTGAMAFKPNFTEPATIYAFDVSEDMKSLSGRRTFAYADKGFPDGIHTDTDGNVWAGCGDGIHVWNSAGQLIGKIWTGVTTNNFAFLPGKVLVFTNAQLWIVEGVKAVGREICRDFGVCESSNNDGSLRKSVFSDVLGEEFVEIAFRAAQSADPQAKLYYNDYNLDHAEWSKLPVVVKKIKVWKAQGIPIDGIGSQTYLSAGEAGSLETALRELVSADVEVAVTELDIKGAAPKDYKLAVQACYHVPCCVGVTVWDIRDTDSWQADQTPLLFDANYNPKPAYRSVAAYLKKQN